MIYCSVCGTANRDGSRYCNQCGGRLDDDTPVTCEHCGAVITKGASQCQSCGIDLAVEPAVVPAAVQGDAEDESDQGEESPAEIDTESDPELEPPLQPSGLPPWLDTVEYLAAAEDEDSLLAETDEEGSEPRIFHDEWSADALPIEPIVGVPYRAHERAELPATAEQRDAADLFAAVAADQVRASALERPAAPKPARADLVWRFLIGFALLLAVVVPLIWPLGPFDVVASVPSAVAAAVQTVDELPAGATALVVFEYDAGLAGDLDPIADAYLHQLFSQQASVLTVSTMPEGAALADMALDRVLSAYPRVRYGEQVLNLGYVPGGEAGVRALAMDLPAAVSVDYRYGASLTTFPLAVGVTDAHSLPLIVVLGRDLTAVQRWVEQVGTMYGARLVAGVPAMIEPAVGPYWLAGQLQGVVAGMGGAAAYERLTTRVGSAGQMLSALRTGIWVVAGLLVLMNLFALVNSWRRRRKA